MTESDAPTTTTPIPLPVPTDDGGARLPHTSESMNEANLDPTAEARRQPPREPNRAEDDGASPGTVDAIAATPSWRADATSGPRDDEDDDLVVPRAEQRYSPRSRRRRRRSQTRLAQRRGVDHVLRYGILAAVLLAPVLVGGVHFASGVALGALGVALGGLAVATYWRRALRPGLVGAALGVWLFATIAQLLPLPIGLVDVLAPDIAEHYRSAYAVLGESPGFVPLSLSPSRTAMALWHVLGFCGMFTAAWLHFRQREHFAWLVPRLAVVGVVFVFVSVLQTTAFEGSILGFYTPSVPLQATPLTTTLVNPNHAGAFFGALAPLALGCALSTRDLGQRYTYAFFYLVLSVAMFLMLSRGAILAWALCHPVFFFLLRSQTLRSRLKAGAVGVAICAVVTASVFVGYRQLAGTFASMVDGARTVEDELQDDAPGEAGDEAPVVAQDAEEMVLRTRLEYADERQRPLEKVLIYRDLAPVLSAYSTTGIGRDAFGEVYPPHATHGVQRTFRHVENEYLEFALEYGPLVALIFFGLLGAGIVSLLSRTDWREAERPLVAGVLTAVIFLAIHNIFDFNLRFPGVGFMLAVILGAVVGRGARYAEVARERGQRGESEADDEHARARGALTSRLRAASGLALVALGAVALLVGAAYLRDAQRGSTGSDIEAVRAAVDAMESDASGREALLATARGALVSRPVDGYLRLLVAIGMLRSGEGGVDAALPWLELARRLNPTDSRTHLLLGRVHAARGDHERAAEAFATAATFDRRPSADVARSAAAMLPDARSLAASLSADPADWMALGVELIRVQRYDDAIELAEHLGEAHPDRLEGLDLLVRVHLALGIPEAAIAPASELIERFPTEPSVYLRRSQVALALGEVREADDILGAGIEAHPKEISLLFTRMELLLYKARSSFEDPLQWEAALEHTLEQLRPLALSRKNQRPRYHFLRAERMRLTDQPRLALRAYEEAGRLNPRWVAPRIGMLNVALELGDIDRARTTLETLASMTPPEYVFQQRRRIDQREAEVERQMLASPIYMGGETTLSEGVRRKLGLSPAQLSDPLSPTHGEASPTPVEPRPDPEPAATP